MERAQLCLYQRMMNVIMILQKSLEYIGFSGKEVLVYLALLELGKGTVAQISRKAGINRPTGYHVLASLEVKELVKASGKEPKQEYMAESPEKIPRKKRTTALELACSPMGENSIA